MTSVIAKAPTGIFGLDEITYGGLPRGRTTLITGGPGCGKTCHGLEEFVSDCVIVLEHRNRGEISTRHLQVVKYRGSMHGTNNSASHQ